MLDHSILFCLNLRWGAFMFLISSTHIIVVHTLDHLTLTRGVAHWQMRNFYLVLANIILLLFANVTSLKEIELSSWGAILTNIFRISLNDFICFIVRPVVKDATFCDDFIYCSLAHVLKNGTCLPSSHKTKSGVVNDMMLTLDLYK